MKTPRTEAEIQRNHMAGHGMEFVRPDFARQLETELIALQEDRDKWKSIAERQMELLTKAARPSVELVEERDQLLATVEGLKEVLNKCFQEANSVNKFGLSMHQAGVMTHVQRTLASAIQSLPPTNLVKRSVLEKCVSALYCNCKFGNHCEICEAKKEAHEELQRTLK